MVIAACIAGASMVALLPLYISSCRAMLNSAERVSLSDRVTTLVGAEDDGPTADDFERALQLVRLCPEHGADREGIRAVTVYCRAIQVCTSLFGRFFPRLNAWGELERRQCAHFAAVVLERSITSSRRMLTQHATEQL